MLRSGRKVLFPVGLYAGLLFALVCLARPQVATLIQSYVAAGMALPFRALGALMPVEARAASTAAEKDSVVLKTAALREREHIAFERGTRNFSVSRDGLEPVLCHVVDVIHKGAAGLPSILVLDISYRELGPVESYVTRQNILLGTVAKPHSDGPDAQGQYRRALDAPVLVHLLHHRATRRLPRRIAAEIVVSEPERRLRFLVEPGSPIDDWPLHCTLPEDPYLAATLRVAGQEVFTSSFAGDPLGEIPSGLLIGKLQVFGYEREGKETLPIDTFVEPVLSPSVLTAVVLWREADGRAAKSTAPLDGGLLHPVRFVRLPAPPPSDQRWFASTRFDTEVMPVGAALVSGERLVGTVAASGPGYVFVSPFGEAGKTWPLILMPDDPELDPIGFLARARARDASGVTLEVMHADGPLVAGQLFSGTVGLHCPSRLWIGSAEFSPESGLLFVPSTEEVPFAGLSVFTRPDEEEK